MGPKRKESEWMHRLTRSTRVRGWDTAWSESSNVTRVILDFWSVFTFPSCLAVSDTRGRTYSTWYKVPPGAVPRICTYLLLTRLVRQYSYSKTVVSKSIKTIRRQKHPFSTFKHTAPWPLLTHHWLINNIWFLSMSFHSSSSSISWILFLGPASCPPCVSWWRTWRRLVE